MQKIYFGIQEINLINDTLKIHYPRWMNGLFHEAIDNTIAIHTKTVKSLLINTKKVVKDSYLKLRKLQRSI